MSTILSLKTKPHNTIQAKIYCDLIVHCLTSLKGSYSFLYLNLLYRANCRFICITTMLLRMHLVNHIQTLALRPVSWQAALLLCQMHPLSLWHRGAGASWLHQHAVQCRPYEELQREEKRRGWCFSGVFTYLNPLTNPYPQFFRPSRWFNFLTILTIVIAPLYLFRMQMTNNE